MKYSIVDERDVSVEFPLPVFRVTVWQDDGARATSYDITEAAITEVLDFARSPAIAGAEGAAGAQRVEVFCKIRLDGGENATVLLETIERL